MKIQKIIEYEFHSSGIKNIDTFRKQDQNFSSTLVISMKFIGTDLEQTKSFYRENTINEIRKRSDAVTVFDMLNSKYKKSSHIVMNLIRSKLFEHTSYSHIHYTLCGENMMNNLKTQSSIKQGKRNRPTFDGRTISHELSLAEVTQ